jgi:acetate kinase
MAMAAPLILVANPGSASRKYALYAGSEPLASLHFEYQDNRVICTVTTGEKQHRVEPELSDVAEAAGQVLPMLHTYGVLEEGQSPERIGIRIVAPTGFFLEDHSMDEAAMARLEAMHTRVPLHIDVALRECKTLRSFLPDVPIMAVSDSAFHATKPDVAWNYGLPIADSDRLELKRFGYHGLSMASAVRLLHTQGKLPPTVIICHLGSGSSVTALWHGKSRDTTMGYSPLDGLIMATRAGSVDISAIEVLKRELGLDDAALEAYLSERSGLLGLSGSSSDIRELLNRESGGDHYAHLALATYIYTVQKAIGQMSAALGGADMLVFTGTVGERSSVIRARILEVFHYLDFVLDHHANEACESPIRLTCISRLAHSRPVFVCPADEAGEIARHVAQKDI